MTERRVPIEVSARHVHLSPEHFKALFGADAELSIYKKISQPGQFAANEFATIVGPKGELQVRVVGPIREYTQVELSATDCKQLGLKAEVKLSGSLLNTPGCRLKGPFGSIDIDHGLIIAHRHLHISIKQAAELGLKHGDLVSIQTHGSRAVTFHGVYVKSRIEKDELSFMLDTDEANAAGLVGAEIAEIIEDHGAIITN